MAKLAEQYVIEHLNRQGFATVQGIKKGVNEWDILAIRVSSGQVEARHIEVQISFDPVSYLSNRNARQRSQAEVEADMAAWVAKKFCGPKIMALRSHFFSGHWTNELVHEVLADSRELDFLRSRGIILHRFTDIVSELCSVHPKKLPFVAGGKDAVEILRSLRNLTDVG